MGARCPGIGVINGCETTCGGWDSNPGPLEEQPILLIAEPSLWILLLYFLLQ